MGVTSLQMLFGQERRSHCSPGTHAPAELIPNRQVQATDEKSSSPETHGNAPPLISLPSLMGIVTCFHGEWKRSSKRRAGLGLGVICLPVAFSTPFLARSTASPHPACTVGLFLK